MADADLMMHISLDRKSVSAMNDAVEIFSWWRRRRGAGAGEIKLFARKLVAQLPEGLEQVTRHRTARAAAGAGKASITFKLSDEIFALVSALRARDRELRVGIRLKRGLHR